MAFAFIGSELEWQQLKSQFAPPSDHRIVAVLPDPVVGPWDDWPATAQRHDDFEALLADTRVQALILAGPVSARAARLRRAAQAGRACLCFHPADLAAIFYHEVTLIAEETRAVLVPFLAGPLHPAWQKLLAICRSGSLGDMASVRIESVGHLPDRPELVAGHYAQAAGLLEALIGEITEITATGDLTSAHVTVHHRNYAGVSGEIRLDTLSSNSLDDLHNWTVAVQASRGHAQLIWPGGLSGPAHLRWSDAQGPHQQDINAPDPSTGPLSELSRAVAGQSHTPSWPDAVRAADLADGVFESLKRRRTVDVYRERRDELASFKGIMTSVGCGLIWLTLLVLVVVAAGEGLKIPGMEWLLAALAVVWVVFLGLQSLRWVLPADGGSKPRSREPH